MIVYSCVVLSTACFAYCIKKQNEDGSIPAKNSRRHLLDLVCLLSIFTILFLVSASRFEVGNDYKRYLEFYRLISVGSYGDLPTETGFNLVVRAMQILFGSQTYLTIFALFAFVTIALMLKAIYQLSDDFFFSFLLFLLLGYYFRSMNTVRYYLALAAAMVSIPYLFRRQYGKMILIILLASTIHKSVLIVLPVYLLAHISWKKYYYYLLLAAGIVAFFMKNQLLKLFLVLYPTYEGTMYLEGGTSYVNIAISIAVLIFLLLVKKDMTQKESQIRFYFQLNFLALLLYTCASFLPEISRVGYYLTFGHLFLLPMAVKQIQNQKKQLFFKRCILGAAILYFIAFLLTADDPLVKLLPYRTWFWEEPVVFSEF